MTDLVTFIFYLKIHEDNQLTIFTNRKMMKLSYIVKIGFIRSEPKLLFNVTEKGHLPIECEVDWSKGKNYYDTFRKRIMFPITDLNVNSWLSGRKTYLIR